MKANHPDLKLRKAPASSPGSPFPVIITSTIPAPPSASFIDVDNVTLQATITAANATEEGLGNPLGSNDTISGNDNPFQVDLDVISSQLPAVLRQAIVQELYTFKSSAPGDSTLLHLNIVLDTLATDYARLLCLLPECLERYEGVDAQDRTVRRVAILNDQAHISIDASIQASAKADLKSASKVPTAGLSKQSTPGVPNNNSTTHSSLTQSGLPRALDAEFQN